MPRKRRLRPLAGTVLLSALQVCKRECLPPHLTPASFLQSSALSDTNIVFDDLSILAAQLVRLRQLASQRCAGGMRRQGASGAALAGQRIILVNQTLCCLPAQGTVAPGLNATAFAQNLAGGLEAARAITDGLPAVSDTRKRAQQHGCWMAGCPACLPRMLAHPHVLDWLPNTGRSSVAHSPTPSSVCTLLLPCCRPPAPQCCGWSGRRST